MIFLPKRKNVKYYEGKLVGERLTPDTCKVLDKLIELSNQGGYIEDLKHCIYNISPLDVEVVKATGTSDSIEKHLGTLTDPQTIGVAYMYYAKRVVMADSVGLGKTVMTSGLINLCNLKQRKNGYTMRYLYFTEKNLVKETRDKLIRFTGEFADAIYGTKKDVGRFLSENNDELHCNLVASYSVAKNISFQEYLREYYTYFEDVPFDLLIIDEAGTVLSGARSAGRGVSEQYTALKGIADMFDMVILLNATPFGKDLNTMYSQLDFVDDTLLPSRYAFNKRYVEFDYRGPYPKPNGKYKNVDEFRRLVSYRCISRTRKSTGAKMIDCTADVVLSDLSPEQKTLLKETSMPNMVYDCPGYFYGNMLESNTENTPKLLDVLGLVAKFTGMGEQVIVYAHYKEAQYAIQNVLFEHGIACDILNGDVNIKERNKIIQEFKLGSSKVLITNVQRGLDFGSCNICIFYSYDPNPGNMVQFEGRMTRDRDIIGKHVYILISRGKELERFKSMVRDRAIASDAFVDSDFSCVMELLLDDERMLNLK